jgi:MoxR-like ATPase
MSFRASDCQFFAQRQDQPVFTDVSEEDRGRYRSIRDRLVDLVDRAASEYGGDTPMKTYVSLYHPSGRASKDLWGCIFPTSARHRGYALQVILIVRPDGAEFGFCWGSWTCETKTPEKQVLYESALSDSRRNLHSLPDDVAEAVSSEIPVDWTYARRWRENDQDGLFDGFKSWVEHARSEDGAGARIGYKMSPEQLERLGEETFTEFMKCAEVFRPMYDYVYGDDPDSIPDRSTTADVPDQEPDVTSGVLSNVLKEAFHTFQADPGHQMQVAVRRERARQIVDLLAEAESLTTEIFDREVWRFESETLLNGRPIKGELFGNPTGMSTEFVDEVQEALATGSLELHGNYAWGSGSQVYGARLKLSAEERTENVRQMAEIVTDDDLTPMDKVELGCDVPGFGDNSATGVTMLAHPTEFAIWNRPSKDVMASLGYPTARLSEFQRAAAALRDELGADDFLELDWFLYLIERGDIDLPDVGPRSSGDDAVRHWAMSLGHGGRLWPECYDDGIAVLGWDDLGDLRQYSTKAELETAIAAHGDSTTRPTNSALACHQFTYVMADGDIVYAKVGGRELLGRGVIRSDYRYDPSRAECRSVRSVEWTHKGSWSIPADGGRVPTKTLTEVTGYRTLREFADRIFVPQPKLAKPQRRTRYGISQATEDLFLDDEEFSSIVDLLARKKNLVLQGPPGVGKTFMGRRLAYVIVGYEDPTHVASVQFHQSYAYEDFVQGIRPDDEGGFRLRDGLFHNLCTRASNDPESKYVLLIDEINRGNLSKIFGELLMLIEADKRGPDHAVSLSYAQSLDEVFSVPPNLYIVGMMNTADRSLALVDYALRRRFAFVDLVPRFAAEKFRRHLEEAGAEPELVETIIGRMNELNEDIREDTADLGPGFEIGHSFFCPVGGESDIDFDWYKAVVGSEIRPLLREYYFDDPAKAKRLADRLGA